LKKKQDNLLSKLLILRSRISEKAAVLHFFQGGRQGLGE
jgi:hypothetical protein